MAGNAPISSLPCGSCKDLLLSATSLNGGEISLSHVTLRRTTEDWRNSVALGCPLCWWIFRHQASLLADPPPSSHLTFVYRPSLRLGGLMTVTPPQEIQVFNRMDHSAVFHFMADEGNAASEYIYRRPPLATASNQEFQLARRWVDNCVETHPECRQAEGPTQFPTRVLDVSHSSASILLCETPVQTEKYAALSYCWGQKHFLRSTRETFETHLQKGIPLSLLPQTIRDAVRVTKELGIRYLWVDSLCIVQDDEEDKAWEIEQMGSVFSNAWVTISAASASSADEGFLTSNEPWSLEGLPTVVLPWINPAGEMGAIHLCHQIPNHNDDEKFLIQDPIHARAWTLQEHKLATRLLGYTKKQLVFACKVLLPSNLQYGDTFDADKRLKPYYTEFDESTDWLIFVREYSKRQVTFSTDKLPAIAGIASLFGKGDDYRAGLWSSTLLYDLLWVAESPQKCQRAPNWRAPSWSWASIDGAVEHLRDHKWGRGTINVGFETMGPIFTRTRPSVECSVTLLRKNAPFGEIIDASLSVKGHLVTLYLNPETMKLYHRGHAEDELVLVGNVELDTSSDLEKLQAKSKGDDKGITLVTCLGLSAFSYDKCITEAVAGLLLEKNVSAEGDAYTRIGFFSTLDGMGDFFWMFSIVGIRPFPVYELVCNGADPVGNSPRESSDTPEEPTYSSLQGSTPDHEQSNHETESIRSLQPTGPKSPEEIRDSPAQVHLPEHEGSHDATETIGNLRPDNAQTLEYPGQLSEMAFPGGDQASSGNEPVDILQQQSSEALRYSSVVCSGTRCQETAKWYAWINGTRYLCTDCGRSYCQSCKGDWRNHDWVSQSDAHETKYHRVVEFTYKIDQGFAEMDWWKTESFRGKPPETRQVVRIV